MEDYSKQLALDLYNSGCVKLQTVTLKTGKLSPIYIDLRTLVSHPSIVKSVSELFSKHLLKDLEYDVLCGVPYTAIPFATNLSVLINVPMLMKRQETKNYGTKKMIEGICVEGEKALIVEDIISSGSSILETVIGLKETGLVVEDVIVVLDREQGGYENLKKLGIRVHSLIKISQLFEILVEEGLIAAAKSVEIMDWIRSTKVNILENVISNYLKLSLEQKEEKPKPLTYQQRSALTSNKVAKRLFELIEEKKSNLCVAIDENRKERVLEIAEQVGPSVVMVKLHCDIIDDFDQEFVSKLKNLATSHKFLVFEDRKFADIGNTVKDQFTRGLHKISDWADLINCHVISGEGIVQSLKSVADLERTGCLIVAELSSSGNLITKPYTDVAVLFAENHSDFVIGFISQSKVSANQKFIHFTPGVNLDDSNDKFDQSYTTPSQAIKEKGADIIIVGRGITKATDPRKASKNYQAEAYNTYLELHAQD